MMGKKERFFERGIRIALTVCLLLSTAAVGLNGVEYRFAVGGKAGAVGRDPAVGGIAVGSGCGFAAEEGAKSTGPDFVTAKNTGITDVSGNMTQMSETAANSGNIEISALSTDDLRVRTEPAVLTQDAPELEMQDGVLTYGGLVVTIPDGIEAKRIKAEDNGNLFDSGHFLSDGSKGRILDLCGAQDVYADRVGGDGIEVFLALPPRVRFLHYTAAYENEAALICAFFDLLPEALGCRMYADEKKNEYTYRLEQDGYLYLFLVKGEEVCLVQEIAEEEDCSFGQLLTDGAACWREDGGTVGFWKKPDAFSYRKLMSQEGISLFYASEKQGEGTKLRLYREGYYETPYQEISGYIKAERDLHVEDVNFDGCLDLTGYDEIYLWNRQAKAYERAQADIPLYSLYHRQFPETGSFWGNSTYQAARKWESVWEAEAIWQWEGNRLVKKRECVVSREEDSLRLFAYGDTPKEILFDETFSTEEWEREEQGRVRALYGQFYDGMVPEEVYGVQHSMEGRKKYIPQGLLDEIDGLIAAGEDPFILSGVGEGKESALLDAAAGKGVGRLSSTVTGRELTREEALSLAERDMAVRRQVQMAAHFNYSYTILEADCDNDGRTDLLWQLDGHFIGGTSGTVEYVFLQGQLDGFYAETDSFYEPRKTFKILSYEGKNYLCYGDYESSMMVCNGYTVRSYVNGRVTEEARIHVVRDHYENPQVWAEAGYEKQAAAMAEKCDAVKRQFDEGGLIEGASERRTDEAAEPSTAYEPVTYRCDLDNDGKEEQYSKWVRELVFFDGGVHLEFWVDEDAREGQDDENGQEEAGQDGGNKRGAQDTGNRGLAMLTEEMQGSADTPAALWAEAYESKNIVFVLYLTGLYDYKITGYLAEETDCSRICEIAVDAVYRVEQERRTVI